jgi:hypothetical protein
VQVTDEKWRAQVQRECAAAWTAKLGQTKESRRPARQSVETYDSSRCRSRSARPRWEPGNRHPIVERDRNQDGCRLHSLRFGIRCFGRPSPDVCVAGDFHRPSSSLFGEVALGHRLRSPDDHTLSTVSPENSRRSGEESPGFLTGLGIGSDCRLTG